MNLFAIRNTFKVYERLKREQHINTLFLSGKAFSVFPIRFIYRLVNETAAGQSGDQDTEKEPNSQFPIPNSPLLAPILKAGFSVPKKKFRSSVNRHRIRRLMVEAWRLNKQEIIAAMSPGMEVHVFLIFTGKEMPKYAQVLPAVKTGIEKLIAIIAPAIKDQRIPFDN